MTTLYKFHLVPVSSIIVEDRDRKELRDIESLADSILRFGLLHPIVINKKGRLVAGERRLRAIQKLGTLFSEHPNIPAHFIEELDEFELKAIELEENIKRSDLTWQEECQSYKTYHDMRVAKEPEWTVEQTADSLGTSRRSVSRKVTVARELDNENASIMTCQTLSAAFNVIDRQRQRSIDTELVSLENLHVGEIQPSESNSLLGLVDDLSPLDNYDMEPIKPLLRPASSDVIEASFLEWAPLYTGKPFNMIHCDFPYGINMNKARQGAVQSYETYSDSEDIYWALVDCLIANRSRIISPSCHIMFWFSMKYYIRTVQTFTAAGFSVNPFPLIWMKSDNVGILPDPTRGPRQIYETALLLSIGDRKIIKATSNAVSWPANKAQAQHLSEKPFVMLAKFLAMLVDSSTNFLDPTCGAGSALVAAEHHEANSVFGLDLDPIHVESSRTALNRLRLSRMGIRDEELLEENTNDEN